MAQKPLGCRPTLGASALFPFPGTPAGVKKGKKLLFRAASSSIMDLGCGSDTLCHN